MDRYAKAAAVFSACCMCALAGCSGTAGNSGVSPATNVVLKTSQQGQSGGLVDYDGDGIEDLFVGAPYALSSDRIGAILIYKGTTNGFSVAPVWVLTGDDNLGFTLENVGDVDGDGKADYASGAYNGDGRTASMCGSVTVYKGGSSGQVIAKVAGDTALDKFGLALKGGCDLNGDGVKDIVVGAPFNSPSPSLYQAGAVYVYFGPDFREASRVRLPATSANKGLGFAVTCGDLNNDGIGDLVAGATGKVLVYYGRAGFNPQTDSPDVTIRSDDGKFGGSLAVIGDLNGDNFNELAIGASNATARIGGSNKARVGRAYIVKGGSGSRTFKLDINNATATPLANENLLTWIDGAGWFDRFGFVVSPAGDVDGDGKPDLAASAIFADKDGATSVSTGLTAGKVYLLLGKDLATDGGPTAITSATVFNGPDANMSYGNFLCAFNRNGPKLLIGAPTVNRQAGCVYGVNLKAGAPVTPIFGAGGTGNSTTGHDCCE